MSAVYLIYDYLFKCETQHFLKLIHFCVVYFNLKLQRKKRFDFFFGIIKLEIDFFPHFKCFLWFENSFSLFAGCSLVWDQFWIQLNHKSHTRHMWQLINIVWFEFKLNISAMISHHSIIFFCCCSLSFISNASPEKK